MEADLKILKFEYLSNQSKKKLEYDKLKISKVKNI